MSDIKRCSKCGIEKLLSERRKGRSECLMCHRESCRKWRITHKEEIKEHDRKWRAEHQEKTKEYLRIYRAKNSEMIKERGRQYRDEHKEDIKEYARKMYIEHREELKERCRKYYYEHTESSRTFTRNYRARKKGNGGKITSQDWIDVLERDGYKCLKCGSMDKLSLDHIIPIVAGGRNDKDNIQVLCKSCNSSKHTDIIDYRVP